MLFLHLRSESIWKFLDVCLAHFIPWFALHDHLIVEVTPPFVVHFLGKVRISHKERTFVESCQNPDQVIGFELVLGGKINIFADNHLKYCIIVAAHLTLTS